jgi:hypothetical protein
MFGFELNDVDPDDSIPRRVAKVHVRQNLHILGPILNAHIDRCFKRLEKDKGIGNSRCPSSSRTILSKLLGYIAD